MLCEQTFLNAGPLLVEATTDGPEGAVLAGVVFNALDCRAALTLFQAVQTAILPTCACAPSARLTRSAAA